MNILEKTYSNRFGGIGMIARSEEEAAELFNRKP